MSRKKSSREQVENGLIVMGRGWYIGGICIVLGAVGSGYLKSSGEIETMRGEFREVLKENAKMSGQLETLIPLIKTSSLNSIAAQPATYGFTTLSTPEFDKLQTGLNFVKPSVADTLRASNIWDASAPTYPVTSDWEVISCQSVNDNDKDLKCSQVSTSVALSVDEKLKIDEIVKQFEKSFK